jgi:hypothetical protein
MEIFHEAKRWVPKTLLLDHLMLDANMILTRLALDEVEPLHVVDEMRAIFAEALKLDDPRLHSQITYSLNHLESLFAEEITASPPKSYVELIERKPVIGMEVTRDIEVRGSELTILLILSPHWRH